MKQFDVFYLFSAAKKGFKLGAVICFGIFVFIRLIFWNYEFTFLEEINNILQIVIIGGLMFSAAIVLFLLMEMMIIKFYERKANFLAPPKFRKIVFPMLLLFQNVLKHF